MTIQPRRTPLYNELKKLGGRMVPFAGYEMAVQFEGIKAVQPVKWKANALRHSYASYRFAQTGDVGRVAGELGNSPAIVHRHYRELVSATDADRWFSVLPESPGNVVQMKKAS